jgi:four helix bundle protein
VNLVIGGRVESEFQLWEKTVPSAIRGDSLWKMRGYRLALFLADIGWNDVAQLASDRRTVGLADQLYRSMGSIGANLAEGYSRGTSRDRARFYEYALGSARETRDWYYKARHVLSDEISNNRIELISQIIRLLLAMIPDQRGTAIREAPELYVGIDSGSQFIADGSFDE